MHGQPSAPMPSSYRGVRRQPETGKWSAVIRLGNERVWLGVHDNPAQAAAVYEYVAEMVHTNYTRPPYRLPVQPNGLREIPGGRRIMNWLDGRNRPSKGATT